MTTREGSFRMDVVQTKVGFPPSHRVSNEYQDRIRFPLQGSAPKDLWTRKVDFEAEIICTHPHTAARHAGEYRAELHNALSAGPTRRRAFHIAEISSAATTIPQLPVRLFTGDDTTISILRGPQTGSTRIRHVDVHTLCFVH